MDSHTRDSHKVSPHTVVPIEALVEDYYQDFNFNYSNKTPKAAAPQIVSNKTRQYPDPPPEILGRFRYSIFVITTYVGIGNCAFFCCLPLLAFEEIFRAMGYIRPASCICACIHVPIATCCLCPCILCRVRKKFRTKRKIQGSGIVDLLLSLGLCCCVASQLLSEARAILLEKQRAAS